MLAVAAALAFAAGTRPSYDAYGWLVWGHQTLRGDLDTNAAPSFKPLPYVVCVVCALFGGAEMRLWMIASIAVSLGGLVFAGRLAWSLAAADGADAPWARAVAAGLAVVGVLCLHDEFPYGYLHYVLSAQSDPMIVAFVLAAADCALRGRERWTFALLVLASLGRPEAWPLLVADAAWLWRRAPGARWAVVAGLVVVGLLWFGVPALTSRSWLVAADNADASGFGPRGNRFVGALGRFVVQAPVGLQVGAVLVSAWALWRRERAVLLLAAGVVVWLAVEVGFALHGWPALGRYVFEPSAVVVVLGAAGAGRLVVWSLPRGGSTALRAAAWTVWALVLASTVVIAVGQGRDAAADLRAQHARTTSIDHLTALVDRLGGPARVRGCGESISRGLASQTVLADTVGRNVSAVGYRFPQPGHPHDPVVVFTPLARGAWRARALRQVTPGCRRLGREGAVVER